MKSSVLTLRKPIPLARSIRWVPAGLFTPPRTVDDLALFITQGALREVMRHLRSDPEQELLGFLLGDFYECPETGARYVVVNTAIRTGHVIAESDSILIPEEEWLGAQLEVRRRRTQLMGWYHSAPFVGPHPSRADLATHNALFREPWQFGLVIATSGDAPAGAFFRSLMGEMTGGGGGVLIPFHEMPDEDQPTSASGRKRTLIDWVNYETRGIVERDESERRPYVAPRPPALRNGPVILSVPRAPDEDESEGEDAPPETDADALVNMLTDPHAYPGTPVDRDAGPGTGRTQRPGVGQAPGASGTAGTAGPATALPLMLPSAAELEELMAESGAAPRERRSSLRTGALGLAVVAAVVLAGVMWSRGSIQVPDFLTRLPTADTRALPTGSTTPTDAATDDQRPATPAEPGASVLAPPVAESASASLSFADSQRRAAGTAPASSPSSTQRRVFSESPAELAPSTVPSVVHFDALVDSLEQTIRNFSDRYDDFGLQRLGCSGLAVGYRSADDAFIALASAHRAARGSLDGTREARYRALVSEMGDVNERFGASKCARP